MHTLWLKGCHQSASDPCWLAILQEWESFLQPAPLSYPCLCKWWSMSECEADKLMEVVMNRHTVNATWKKLQNVQLPRICLLKQYFLSVILPMTPGSILPKLNYRSTVSLSESILSILDMHILFSGITSFEKRTQLIYMALPLASSITHSPFAELCVGCVLSTGPQICKQGRHRTSSVFSGNTEEWGWQTCTQGVTTECEQCWTEPGTRCRGDTQEWQLPETQKDEQWRLFRAFILTHSICSGLST